MFAWPQGFNDLALSLNGDDCKSDVTELCIKLHVSKQGIFILVLS